MPVDMDGVDLWVDQEVRKYFKAKIASSYKDCDPEEVKAWLRQPPRYTTARLNLKKVNTVDEGHACIRQHLVERHPHRHYSVSSHPIWNEIVVIRYEGKVAPDQEPDDACQSVIVDAACGLAVLRGADVFAPGVLAAEPRLAKSVPVKVYADIAGKTLRGTKEFSVKHKIYLGRGISQVSRADLFNTKATPSGVGVTMVDTVHNCPSLNALERQGIIILQNLPSIITSLILNPVPGDCVLDACAAPGGKTTHLAALLQGRGSVVAIDRSQNKINQISANSALMDVSDVVDARVADSTKLLSPESPVRFDPESFDKVLLDAPCSALGQRPQFVNKMKLKELLSFPKIQKKLFNVAFRLLKSGGTLVYSTCTITQAENEEMVEWILENYKDLSLVSCLNDDPGYLRFGNPKSADLTGDTIGFFVAKFCKKW